MLVILSPAKKQEFETRHPELEATKPRAIKESALLVETLKKLSRSQIKTLMKVSDAIADLNYQRFQAFEPSKYNRSNAKQCVLAFKGDAYRALDAESLTPKAIDFLQDHLVILSGLYGCLKPLDLIQPYRLEMKTALKNSRGKDLYQFWGDTLAEALSLQVQSHKNKTIINLASGEYFKAIKQAKSLDNIITVSFKEKKGADYKTIGIHAKRARGLMTRFIATQQIDVPQKLVDFNEERYQYNKKLSTDTELVFTR